MFFADSETSSRQYYSWFTKAINYVNYVSTCAVSPILAQYSSLKMQRSTFWEHKDGFLYIFVHLHLKLNESKPQQNFFKQRSGSAPAESSVTMIRQDTKINIPWQPGLNLPYKVSQPPFRDRPQSLKNSVRGHLVCAGHGEQAVPCRQKPSAVQRRTSYTLGIGA